MYIPTGHPVDYTIKDLAEKRGQKPDLYRYIATGSDEEGKVKRILDEVKNSGSYNLNLLALSDAHIVNIEGLHKKITYSVRTIHWLMIRKEVFTIFIR